ncbi:MULTISPECIES: hypothetical protein [unclassified Streptomyces]|uniref:hypothetical protein n=1 Tax=unclassified Streptomyces TaxID=2593676 RepID=UPI002E19CBB5|nr:MULTISPECIES: hypothetical protein [unclassified Streptomyces]
MKPRGKRWLTFTGVRAGPSKPLTGPEIVVMVVAAVVVFGAMGLVIGHWDMVIGAGVCGTGSHLICQWWWRRTSQPEGRDDQ